MPLRLIYLVSLLEGYSTLAVQIIAMRLAIPVVGSSIVLTSVFMGVILLALSFGYYSGGVVASRLNKHELVRALGSCLLFSGVWYVVISFMFERQVIEWLLETTGMYILTLFLVSLMLFFVPVFIASHTIPLLTEMIPEKSKGKAAGKMLFVSTIGSFLGSVVTSIVLFEWIGVYNTGVLVGVVLCLLAGGVLFFYKRTWAVVSVVSGAILGVFFFKNSLPEGVIYAFDSAYQEIRVTEGLYLGDAVRVFKTNGGMSSALYKDPGDGPISPFKYITESIALTEEQKPKSILVIGSAGFVYPMEVAQYPYVELIDTIDIDPSVKQVAEEYFLEEKLDAKIGFYPYSARYAVRKLAKEGKTYDMIFLDAYNGKSLPSELVTLEFFEDIEDIRSQDGFLVANVILDSALSSDYAKRVLSTMKAVFGGDSYLGIRNVTQNVQKTLDNFIVTTVNKDGYAGITYDENIGVYTDMYDGAEIDGVSMLNDL